MPPRPLIVRLRNWVGDVVLGIPALKLLHEHGYQLTLVGKPWARALLEGYPWEVSPLPSGRRARSLLYRTLRQQCRTLDSTFDARINTLVLPTSFSSAWETRWAGLQTIGYRHEARTWLLSRALTRPAGLHELEVYWGLANALLERSDAAPSSIDFSTSPNAVANALQLLSANGLVHQRFVVLCPFAGGTFEKWPKAWPAFAEFASQAAELKLPLLLCPGPGEDATEFKALPHCTVIPNVALGTYAALLKSAALMISNDTGPGHLSAAVGTPTLSVLGRTDPAQWRAWGPNVQLAKGSEGAWPSPSQVLRATRRMLDNCPEVAL